ncbi:MAG: hypothetical protein VX354_01360 [Pseudomonadota bacterium]
MRYQLITKIVEFEIKQEPLGMWDICVDGMPTLSFTTPEDAAIAVFSKSAGYTDWDNSDSSHTAPKDLSGWEKHDD